MMYLLDTNICIYLIKKQPLYGTLRASLVRAGKMIGPLDLLIAAHAVYLGATLVTNNVKEFSRVSDLKIETWA